MKLDQRSPGSAGFAVVDVETTGFSPHTDRVIEVAVVHVSIDGQITSEFCTLVNPLRSVGVSHVHKITEADVSRAPVFADAGAEVWDMLAGRVLVAHNAGFDKRFLDAEFSRCGMNLPPLPVMCTMEMSRHYLPDLRSRKLSACCQAVGIRQTGQHSALGDAHATARLLAYYRSAHRQLPAAWSDALATAARCSWTAVPRPRSATFEPVLRAR